MPNLETDTLLFSGIFSNAVKTVVVPPPNCLSSEILLKVQEESLTFKRRSQEPTRLG